MKIFDGSKVVSGWKDSPVTSAEWCPFCLTKEEDVGGKGPIPVANGVCLRCGARHYRVFNPVGYWERDLEMPALEIEHLKLMLEGEKLLRENAEDSLFLAKEKITSRNRIIKSLRAALREKNARTQV